MIDSISVLHLLEEIRDPSLSHGFNSVYGFIIKTMTNVTFWVNVTFFSDRDHIIYCLGQFFNVISTTEKYNINLPLKI